MKAGLVIALLVIAALAAQAAPAAKLAKPAVPETRLLIAACNPAAAAHFDTVMPFKLNSDAVELVVAPLNSLTKKIAARETASGACVLEAEVAQDEEAYLLSKKEWAQAAWVGARVFFVPKTDVVVVIISKASEAAFGAVKAERELLRVIPKEPRAATRGPTKPVAFQKTVTKAQTVNKINGDEYYSVLEGLTGVKPIIVRGSSVTINTRYTLSTGNDYSAEWIADYFSMLGYTDVRFQPFTYGGKQTNNIIAVKRGTTSPNEIIVVGAHMDSTSPSASTSAPGCVDNGSGTAGVLNLASAFANVTSARTIYYVLFSAEEQGLIGSEYFVEEAQADRLNIVAALTMDMIGYSNQYFGVLIEGTSNNDIRALMDNYEANLLEYASDLEYEKSYYSFGSDHVSFQRADIPAFLAIELDGTDYSGYHSTTDRINYLDVDQSVGIMRAMAGSLWDYAESIN